MTSLIAACALFLLIHSLISGTGLRATITDAIGEKTYRGIFSLVSLGAIVWMAMSYNAVSETGSRYLWNLGNAGHGIALLLVFLGLMFAVIGVATKNPTAMQQEGLLAADDPATGIVRITRHPFLVGVVLWAAAHLLANGDLGSLIFFGTFLLVSLIGMPNIDAKRARRDPEGWARFAARTSRTPFAAILKGRNSLKVAEIGWPKILAGLIVYAAILYFHGWIFGVDVLHR
ncbi:NnrU family protein [Emcibacter sp. SYSU 3D8]|uniref:NnrU family protein n=1 Tax=Emcibacter sp. SYSU 3D8 TaxID=3133969 RepID=UPI0031FE52DA